VNSASQFANLLLKLATLQLKLANLSSKFANFDQIKFANQCLTHISTIASNKTVFEIVLQMAVSNTEERNLRNLQKLLFDNFGNLSTGHTFQLWVANNFLGQKLERSQELQKRNIFAIR
jgi:hypothetical protein